MMDSSKSGSHRRRASAGSHKTLHTDWNLGSAKSTHDCLVEFDPAWDPAQSPSKNLIGPNSRLKDVHNSLVTSKELLKVMARIGHLDNQNSTGLSLFIALKFELDQACAHVAKLIQEQKHNQCHIDSLLKHFQEERSRWRSRQREKIHMAISSIAGELEKEKKLRMQTERLNKRIGKELSNTKELLLKANEGLEGEKRAREILEQACDELTRAMGEDRAEVEELKRESAKVYEEVEKEREMLQLADILREERVQMKLSEARFQLEEKNEIVDELRNELELYLKTKRGEERESGSPSHDKFRELEKYLRETLPCTYKEQNGDEIVNKVEHGEDGEEDSDSADSDLHLIELNVDNVSKSFKWVDGPRNERSTKTGRPIKQWEIAKSRSREDNLDAYEKRGCFKFTLLPRKKEVEDEIERYDMIKDLRDHIVSGSKMSVFQDSASPSHNELGLKGTLKDQNGVVCEG